MRFRPRRVTDPAPASARAITALFAQVHPRSIDKPLIRLGSAGDGGYLVPDDLDDIEACFSPGVGDITDFESDCARRGMKVFMADGSVDRPKGLPVSFNFVNKHIGATSNSTITLDEWVADSLPGSQRDLLLQMDIEGAEFDALINTSDRLLARFRIIVVEVHELHHFAFPSKFDQASQMFAKLLRAHFCVHVHANNCCGTALADGVELPLVAEFTFLRRDRVSNVRRLRFTTSFPHPLDADNVPAVEELALPPALYRSGL